ncbi:MAG: DNA polymerase III subunit gamma/tau [Candidatus Anammoximicrobium sp.]|nr:DNA polymerase III subunit gamma/tau [Candidatus Anammoximicrobium sp.]
MPSQSDALERSDDLAAQGDDRPREYVVVARRYRPKTFGELVGQQQVAQALSNAITTSRVGHAYLFTGARGVGKTSTARILAKCLNCRTGPTPEPCGQCDACVSIASGDDVDVLEIDGASNRRIDEIRQLRSNVNIRPSRSRFKIYIIDEVHMLTNEAFNALLKTLEEPPEHVKFIFCTTNPEKMPITVLSRCQRFDFAPVPTDSIIERLRFIVQEEGVQADEAALRLLARRAGGSMRDSQSLLEQLLSFSGERITENDVHAMLGTAQVGRLRAIVGHLIDREAGPALEQVDAAIREGVDVGQLAEQLLGYLRDVAAALVGCQPDLMLHVASADFAAMREAGQRWGLETTLAALQILDQALTRMRQSTQVRTLLEIALVRICKLEDLDSLPGLIAQFRDRSPPAAGAPPAPRTRREMPPVAGPRPGPPERAAPVSTAVSSPVSGAPVSGAPVPGAPVSGAPVSGTPVSGTPVSGTPVSGAPVSGAPVSWTEEVAQQAWRETLEEISGLKANVAGDYAALAVLAPNQLVVHLKTAYNKEYCERPEVKCELEQTLSRRAGRAIRIDFVVAAEADSQQPQKRPPPTSRRQRLRELEQHPLVQEAKRLFDAEVIRVDERRPS